MEFFIRAKKDGKTISTRYNANASDIPKLIVMAQRKGGTLVDSKGRRVIAAKVKNVSAGSKSLDRLLGDANIKHTAEYLWSLDDQVDDIIRNDGTKTQASGFISKVGTAANAIVSDAKKKLGEISAAMRVNAEADPNNPLAMTKSQILIGLIQDEWDAIRAQEAAIASGMFDRSECDVIRDTLKEEKTHIGQYQAMLDADGMETTATIMQGTNEGNSVLKDGVGDYNDSGTSPGEYGGDRVTKVYEDVMTSVNAKKTISRGDKEVLVLANRKQGGRVNAARQLKTPKDIGEYSMDYWDTNLEKLSETATWLSEQFSGIANSIGDAYESDYALARMSIIRDVMGYIQYAGTKIDGLKQGLDSELSRAEKEHFRYRDRMQGDGKDGMVDAARSQAEERRIKNEATDGRQYGIRHKEQLSKDRGLSNTNDAIGHINAARNINEFYNDGDLVARLTDSGKVIMDNKTRRDVITVTRADGEIAVIFPRSRFYGDHQWYDAIIDNKATITHEDTMSRAFGLINGVNDKSVNAAASNVWERLKKFQIDTVGSTGDIGIDELKTFYTQITEPQLAANLRAVERFPHFAYGFADYATMGDPALAGFLKKFKSEKELADWILSKGDSYGMADAMPFNTEETDYILWELAEDIGEKVNAARLKSEERRIKNEATDGRQTDIHNWEELSEDSGISNNNDRISKINANGDMWESMIDKEKNRRNINASKRVKASIYVYVENGLITEQEAADAYTLGQTDAGIMPSVLDFNVELESDGDHDSVEQAIYDHGTKGDGDNDADDKEAKEFDDDVDFDE
jgi:hypothetical protein